MSRVIAFVLLLGLGACSHHFEVATLFERTGDTESENTRLTALIREAAGEDAKFIIEPGLRPSYPMTVREFHLERLEDGLVCGVWDVEIQCVPVAAVDRFAVQYSSRRFDPGRLRGLGGGIAMGGG